MTTPEGNAAGTAADPTVQTQGQPGGQPDYKSLWEKAAAEALDFKNRFTGLQGKYQQEQEKWTAATNKATQFEQQLQALTGEKEALNLKATALEAEKGSLAGELTKAKGQAERVTTIAKQFPQLLPFEADGLLPDGIGEDLIKKLTAFSERMSGMSKEALADFQKGSTPPPPSETPATSSKALFQLANQHLRAGDQAKYDEFYSAALTAQAQGK